MSRFLIAASALTVTTLVQGANWIPTSPLVQIGNDCDLFFDASTYLEVTDNLYSGASQDLRHAVARHPRAWPSNTARTPPCPSEFKASRSLVQLQWLRSSPDSKMTAMPSASA